ncbi:MAG: DNA alkylation repair protein [Capnocytophaga sp.]|nr:DNA alkylation repair protein [Capnocytophaga sp.]
MTIDEIKNRKGAQKASTIPAEVLSLLNKGEIPTVNLTEWLAVNHSELIKSTFPAMNISGERIDELVFLMDSQKKPSVMNTVKLVGNFLYERYGTTPQYAQLFEQMSTHISDSVRCYACYLMALYPMPLKEKLNTLKPLVADKHFGVREIIWMALRPEMSEQLAHSIILLSDWAESDDENIRRFSSESLRPRGVWCAHIEELKEQPEQYLPILNKLKSDPAKYVQDSVGNWLNDASKTRPDFVRAVCTQWEKESPTKATQYIIKKALRTIENK